MKVYNDWNCRLLHSMQEPVGQPGGVADALRLLHIHCGFHRIYLMPVYDCAAESVPMFLLRRELAMRELRGYLPEPPRLQAAGYALLQPGLSQVPALHRLRLPGTNCLPLQLPLLPDRPGMAQELNCLLYHTPYRLLLMSFELCAIFYPPDELERLAALPNVVYQFGYGALCEAPMRRLLRDMLRRNTHVLFGSGTIRRHKAARFDLGACLREAEAHTNETRSSSAPASAPCAADRTGRVPGPPGAVASGAAVSDDCICAAASGQLWPGSHVRAAVSGRL